MLRSVAGKTLFEQRRAIIWWSLGTIAMVATIVAYYPSVRADPSLTDFMRNLPESVQALSGGANLDWSSPDGWLNGQLFANVIPLIFIIYGVVLGAGAIGREEDRGTAELLLTMPVTRERVVLEKALAALALLTVLGAVLVVSLLLGTEAFDMDIGLNGILAACLSTVLLGTTFGGMALAISAAFGPRAHAAAITGAVAFAAFILNSLAPVIDSLNGWEKLSAFYWYQASNPIGTGFDAGHLAVLAVATLALAALAVFLFDRRDVNAA
jgi:beta-exotoxin I transport system permease protein